MWEDQEARANYKILGGHRKYATLENATHVLRADGFHRNYRHWVVLARRRTADCLSPAWFRFLDVTRPIRQRLGLRQKGSSST